jgi:hypothetical protein
VLRLDRLMPTAKVRESGWIDLGCVHDPSVCSVEVRALTPRDRCVSVDKQRRRRLSQPGALLVLSIRLDGNADGAAARARPRSCCGTPRRDASVATRSCSTR